VHRGKQIREQRRLSLLIEVEQPGFLADEGAEGDLGEEAGLSCVSQLDFASCIFVFIC